MDLLDRVQLCVRYNILSLLCLFGYIDSVSFDNQLRKVKCILRSNEPDHEVRSARSSSCYVAENYVHCTRYDQTSGPSCTGESSEETGSEEDVDRQSDGGENNER